jgi:hypothetical protein
MNKHTPGPWFVGGATGYINQLSISPSIGCVYGAGEELLANAQLVAAAPELLAALQLMLDVFLDTEGTDGARETEAKEIARAAVAKAFGGACL